MLNRKVKICCMAVLLYLIALYPLPAWLMAADELISRGNEVGISGEKLDGLDKEPAVCRSNLENLPIMTEMGIGLPTPGADGKPVYAETFGNPSTNEFANFSRNLGWIVQALPVSVVDVPPPANNCQLNQQAIQAALNTPGSIQVVFPPGHYCLIEPLVVHSFTQIVGAGRGDDPTMNTILEQHTPGASIFHLPSVRGVSIERLRLLPPEYHNGPPPDNGCLLNPVTGDCLFRRSSGIAIYGSERVRIEQVHVIGGTYGIALLDQPVLEAPQGGPDAAFCALSGNRFAIAFDLCSAGANNRFIYVRDNVIEEARTDGILVLNAIKSHFARNTVRKARVNGIKVACGPVVDTVWQANYLYGNGADGFDTAWAWTHEVSEYCVCFGPNGPTGLTCQSDDSDSCPEGTQKTIIRLLTLEEPPDGPFRGNTLRGNLAWDNGLNGIALKAQKKDPCGNIDWGDWAADANQCPALQRLNTDECTSHTPCNGKSLSPLLQIGDLDIYLNAAWGNGRAGKAAGACPIPISSQFGLKAIVPPGACQGKPKDLHVVRNLWMNEPPSDQCGHKTFANAMALGMLRAAWIAGNWMDGPIGDSCSQPALYLFDQSIRWTDMPRNYVDVSQTPVPWCCEQDPPMSCRSDVLSLNDIMLGDEPTAYVRFLLSTSLPPTKAARLALLNAVSGTDLYHIADDDNDVVPNIVEALSGTDPLSKSPNCWNP